MDLVLMDGFYLHTQTPAKQSEILTGDSSRYTVMLESNDDQNRLAVVIPLFAPRSSSQPRRNQRAVVSRQQDRSDAIERSKRQHPANGGPR